MKVVLFRAHGGPEVLEYTNFPTPEPKPSEALIRVHAAALNRMDVMVRNGWPGLKLELPHINGADGAGEVVELGSPLPEGDRERRAQQRQSRSGAEGGAEVREVITGRLYGPSLFPKSLETIYSAVKIGLPIIGAGGIYSKEYADAMLSVGALAVQVDAALWNPASTFSAPAR